MSQFGVHFYKPLQKSFSAFTSGRLQTLLNLRDLLGLLVTVQLSFNTANPQLPSGSFRCDKNCPTCLYICRRLTTNTFFSTGETRPIKSNLTCDKKPHLHDSM